LGEDGGFADARFTSEKIYPAGGEARAEDTVKFGDIGREVGFFGCFESLLGGSGGGVLFAVGAVGDRGERGKVDLGKSVPFFAGRALTSPFGELVTAGRT
jgi:hypothetical protein